QAKRRQHEGSQPHAEAGEKERRHIAVGHGPACDNEVERPHQAHGEKPEEVCALHAPPPQSGEPSTCKCNCLPKAGSSVGSVRYRKLTFDHPAIGRPPGLERIRIRRSPRLPAHYVGKGEEDRRQGQHQTDHGGRDQSPPESAARRDGRRITWAKEGKTATRASTSPIAGVATRAATAAAIRKRPKPALPRKPPSR